MYKRQAHTPAAAPMRYKVSRVMVMNISKRPLDDTVCGMRPAYASGQNDSFFAPKMEKTQIDRVRLQEYNKNKDREGGMKHETENEMLAFARFGDGAAVRHTARGVCG